MPDIREAIKVSVALCALHACSGCEHKAAWKVAVHSSMYVIQHRMHELMKHVLTGLYFLEVFRDRAHGLLLGHVTGRGSPCKGVGGMPHTSAEKCVTVLNHA